MRIIKRNGVDAEFDRVKIYNAIQKANKVEGFEQEITDDGADAISIAIENTVAQMGHVPDVEEIQEMVETRLMKAGAYETAKRYIRYRHKRQLARRENTTDASIMSLVAGNNRELAEENANKSTIMAATQRDYIAGEVSRDLTRRMLLPNYIAKAHDEGAIHFHK